MFLWFDVKFSNADFYHSQLIYTLFSKYLINKEKYIINKQLDLIY